MRGISYLTVALLSLAGAFDSFGADTVRLMTFNIWVGGESGQQPLSQTAEVIKASGADIVGMQEARGEEQNGARPDNGRKVAEMLGWHYFDQSGGSTAVLSRYPFVTNTPQKWGVSIRLPSGKEIWLFNVHFPASPYQPYQLLNIPYGNARFVKTAGEAVDEARKARGANVRNMLAELQPVLAKGQPVFLTGDFNEPSHQDWTERAAAARKVPLAVPFPATIAVTSAGLRDAYRAVYPDELAHLGWTWTPITSPDDPKDRHDRIDLVFFNGVDTTVEDCKIVGESRAFADVVVQPYPSDHRAVVATFVVR
jgi:exodeoxyribonuclease III